MVRSGRRGWPAGVYPCNTRQQCKSRANAGGKSSNKRCAFGTTNVAL
eukprot:IDg8715t1